MNEPVAAEGRLTVLYDARCRVCTRIAGRLAGADTEHRLRLRPLQRAADDEWPRCDSCVPSAICVAACT